MNAEYKEESTEVEMQAITDEQIKKSKNSISLWGAIPALIIIAVIAIVIYFVKHEDMYAGEWYQQDEYNGLTKFLEIKKVNSNNFRILLNSEENEEIMCFLEEDVLKVENKLKSSLFTICRREGDELIYKDIIHLIRKTKEIENAAYAKVEEFITFYNDAKSRLKYDTEVFKDYDKNKAEKYLAALKTTLSNSKLDEGNLKRKEIYFYIGLISSRVLEYYSTAITNFTEAIEIDPEDAKAYYNRGFAYYSGIKDYSKFRLSDYKDCKYEIDKIEKAIVDCTKAIELEPRHALAFNLRGLIHRLKDKYPYYFFDTSIESDIESDTEFKSDNNDKALKDYTKAIEIDPELDFVYCNRGNAYINLLEYDKAIADYSKAIEINQDNANAYFKRGNIFYKQEKYAEAISDFTRCIEIDPEEPTNYYNRGLSFDFLAKYDKAIEDYLKCIELNYEASDAYNNLGLIYKSQKKYEKAIDCFQKALKNDPDHDYAEKNLDKLYKELNR